MLSIEKKRRDITNFTCKITAKLKIVGMRNFQDNFEKRKKSVFNLHDLKIFP